jgi:hypothetical protein
MLLALSPAVTAALVAAAVSVVSALVGALWLDRRAHKVDLETDHRHEQRKALLALISRYHGGLLEHATSWNYRMLNLFENAPRNWLRVAGSYSSPHYYFDSAVYRFLALLSLAQKFESEEIFIDARYVEQRELEFVKFIKAFHWVMSDVALFAGLGYGVDPVDHFYSDRLRAVCDAFMHDGRSRRFASSRPDCGSLTLQSCFRCLSTSTVSIQPTTGFVGTGSCACTSSRQLSLRRSGTTGSGRAASSFLEQLARSGTP